MFSKFVMNLLLCHFRREEDVLGNGRNRLPSKSMSMSNLNNKNLDRMQMKSNVSTISADSTTSINSLGKKRRAPLPPMKKQQLILNQGSIPEETPSMVHLENNNHVPKSNHKPPEEVNRRILPEVPIEKSPKVIKNRPVPKTEPEPDIVPKSHPVIDPEPPKSPVSTAYPSTPEPIQPPVPEPAPRSSILEGAKIDTESPKKKKSAKKQKSKEKSPVKEQDHPQVPIMSDTSHDLGLKVIEHEQRPLSPDSALASSESSGSSLRKQGKIAALQQNLVSITPYEQFKPVVRKSAKIQEKIAIFSGQSSPEKPSSTTGKKFPIPRKHHLEKVKCNNKMKTIFSILQTQSINRKDNILIAFNFLLKNAWQFSFIDDIIQKIYFGSIVV